MLKNSLIIFILLIVNIINAQNDCDCAQNFQVLQHKARNNYAGYDNRINAKNQADFMRLTDSITKAVGTITDGYKCYEIMNRWVSYFRDGHCYLNTTFSPATTNAISTTPPILNLDSTIFYNYLSKNKANLNAIEGVWRNDEGSYFIAIKRDEKSKTSFSACILKASNPKWKVGMVKFGLENVGNSFKVNYYMADFSSLKTKGFQDKNVLILENLGVWEKMFPEPTIKADIQKISRDQVAHFKMIDDQTAYIRASTFSAGPEIIDSVINFNKQKLLNTPRLIIDIRGNGGGSNTNYSSLLPFLYTKPYRVESEGGFVLASEDNIAIEKKTYEQSWNSLSEESKKIYAKDMEGWKKSIDTMEMFKDKRYYYGETELTKFDSITTHPKQIAILMDKGCASSAEWFLLEAENSHKVTLFGQNTAGVMDNSNVRPHPLACASFTLMAASGRRGGADKREIDNIGFKPNVYIDENQEDWVKVVLDYWKKKEK